MGVKEDIFEEFFQKLENDEEFPNSVVDGLRELKTTNRIDSKENIFEIIKERCEDTDKN